MGRVWERRKHLSVAFARCHLSEDLSVESGAALIDVRGLRERKGRVEEVNVREREPIRVILMIKESAVKPELSCEGPALMEVEIKRLLTQTEAVLQAMMLVDTITCRRPRAGVRLNWTSKTSCA